ncbi:MAG: exodeoxyribonuclease VII large subunit [Thermodesulfobacteriota bacterium]|nr:exodeoxyribonuclease VII large subunit [Thermodesulfobacteriota bacterium]
MINPSSNRIQTVTEITKSIKGLLESGFNFVTVVGEISNLRRPYSGHLYFTLKDRESQLKAVMFRSQQRYLRTNPGEGTEVICTGRISVYEPRGEYQLIVDVMDLKGAGELRIAFEMLKKKLAEEGLFDESQKQSLPLVPESVTLVTSPSGAALFDFLKIAETRLKSVPIEIFPVRVQGQGAADEIVEALTLLNERKKTSVIVLCRGGGSIEDLWPFNEEKVARAVHASEMPVVSAIGHEIDFTISDFAADYRAPTPTAAAEAVIPDGAAIRERISFLKERLTRNVTRIIDDHYSDIETFGRMLGDPTSMLSHFMLVLDQSQIKLFHAFSDLLADRRTRIDRAYAKTLNQNPTQRLSHQRQWTMELVRQLNLFTEMQLERKRKELKAASALLDAVSPLAILGRGYSIARSAVTQRIIRTIDQVKAEDPLEILLQKGKIDCKVTGTRDSEWSDL